MHVPPAPASPALVLFDIDGTLTRRIGPHHLETLQESVRKVMRVETDAARIDTAGALDCDILMSLMTGAGITRRAAREALPAVIQMAQRLYTRRCPGDLRRRVCPGVRQLLSRLARRNAVTGLVTGNLSRIGWKKMERAGLKHYFRYGAFAEMGRTRAELAGIAIREARSEGWIARDSRLFLVGDHPNDVNAAKSNGMQSVAVATGVISRDELARHAPDFLLDDLRSVTMETFFA